MLSIIIPTLNEEKHLPLLLEAIKKSSLDDYEVIVADAGSKDNTREIAQNYGCRLVKGGLPAKGRNEGAKIARGDFFLFSDADSIFPFNSMEEVLKEFNQRGLGIAAFPVYSQGKMIDKIAYRTYNLWIKLTQGFTAYAAHCILVRRDVFEKVSGFNEKIRIGEDHYFAQKAAKISKFAFLEIEPVLTSIRRFEKDGRFKTYLKFILTGIYMFIFGPPKSDIFKYDFGYSDQDDLK